MAAASAARCKIIIAEERSNMKAFALFLTTIVVISAGTALGAEYYQPAYPQPANAWQPIFQAPAGYAPPPVAYAAPPQPVYYASPPVVYYSPPPPPPVVNYTPAPVFCGGGYGYDPFWGGVNVLFSYSDSSGHDHHDNGGGYGHGGYGGSYGHGGYDGNYGRGGYGGNYGHGSSGGNYSHGGHGRNYGHGAAGPVDIVNGVLGGGYGHGVNYGRGGGYGHGGGNGHGYSQIASTVFGNHGNAGGLFRARH
jgi:hypothetical protein